MESLSEFGLRNGEKSRLFLVQYKDDFYLLFLLYILPLWKLSLYSKQRNAGKSLLNESTLLTILLNPVLEEIHWLFTSLLLLCPFPDFLRGSMHISMKKSRVKRMKCVERVGSTLFFFVVTIYSYFHEESTLSEKSMKTRPFLMNTALYPWNDSTLWVDSQKGRLCSFILVHARLYCKKNCKNEIKY